MKKLLILFIFGFSSLFLLASPSFIHASGFTTAYLRVASKANSALFTTVCAWPSTANAGTENKLTIVFPDDFSISTNTSNWQVSNSDLPANSTPWPLSGSHPTSISGQSVTFLTSDLTQNALYCFNLSSSLSSAGSSGHDKNGTISTRNSSNSLIDSTTYAVSVSNNNQINVTASVDPKVSDLPITIESTTPGTNFPPDSVLSYKITYGSNTAGPNALTIQAQWTEGTIQGSPTPSVEVLSYVIGSASNAYGGTAPVIDTVNRTITWDIASIPGGTTGRTVTFSLKTNDAYQGTQGVDFNVSARAISGSTITPDDNVSQTYLYDASTITPSPTPTPTQTPGSGGGSQSQGSSESSPTATPQPEAIAKLSILGIFINSISKSEAQIFVTTNKNARLKILYGFTAQSLNQSIVSTLSQTQSLIALDKLDAKTDYFFKVIATDENGNSIASDIFTFQTAEVSEVPSVNLGTLFVTSNDNLIFNPTLLTNSTLSKNILVVPISSVFSIQFSLDKTQSLKKIQAIIRNANVLGFNTEQAQASTNYIDLVEVSPGIYTGKLVTPVNPGKYAIYVRLLDYKGNIVEKKISDLNVTNKLSVFRKGSKNEPIENVRMLLYLYNKILKTYQLISPQILPIKNPDYSDPEGTYELVLPLGQYKAEFQAIGYDPQTIVFKIDPKEKGYPVVYLKQQPFNILNTIRYYLGTISDSIIASQDYLRTNSYSNRLLDLSSFGAVLVFIIISTLSISARTHVTIFYLPYFLIFKLKILLKGHKSNIIFGKVIDSDTNAPISRCDVSILSQTDGVLAKLKTNKLGEFYYQGQKDMQYKIKIVKEGFESKSSFAYDKDSNKEFPTPLKIKRIGDRHYSLLWTIYIYLEDFLGICMEALILVGIVIQLYFVLTFGLLRVAPFLALTVINLILIFTFLYKPRNLINS